MNTKDLQAFPPGVGDQLKVYVYRLLDPRNGETFYVGKGKGNRLFSHARGEIPDDDGADDKLERIRQIKLAGFEVAHVIHRHGLDDDMAYEVEAALIDAYPGLTNAVGGYGSGDRGAMHVKEVIPKYSAEEAIFSDIEKAILISVNRQASLRNLYDAVRYAWKINIKRANKADVILATKQGLIVGAYKVFRWLPATEENFPGRWSEGDGSEGRYGFEGERASDEVWNRYVRKRVPDKFRKRGASFPIKYTW